MKSRSLFWILTHLLLMLFAVMLSGCTHETVVPERSVTRAAEGVAGIIAHTESAQRHVESAKPLSSSTGKVLLQAATEEHTEVLMSASQVRAALDQAQTRFEQVARDLAQWKTDYSVLESKWYVVWGRRIERAIWFLAVGWLGAGILSVLLGVGSPLGMGVWLGKEILHLAPAMNIFAWIRNWIEKRREAKAAAKVSVAKRKRLAA